ncbi:cyclic nucleotide-binding domain-containing protein [Vibrio diabolicus]|uniref:hypothetical protein n=1 Tax=Vibrio diabolicus TaxID=50719 RepID=UPI0029410710|nr:hypothetical protein [Vibrio diabolicus]MDV5061850.1 hypothetical protein [Vibrio diabolicus]
MSNTLEDQIGLERISLLVKCGNFEHVAVEPGDVIIREGQTVTHAYWADDIEFSRIKYTKAENLYLGQSKLTKHCLGDAEIITGQPSTFTFIAKSSAKLTLMPVETLINTLIEDSKISMWYTKTLSIKYHRAMEGVLTSSQKSLSHIIVTDIINRHRNGLSEINMNLLDVETLTLGCSNVFYEKEIQTLIDADLIEISPIERRIIPKSLERLTEYLEGI